MKANHAYCGTRQASSRRGRARTGSLLVCVMVCLGVVVALMASSLKTVLMAQRQSRVERQARQADWLLQAAAERAAYAWRTSADYQGETWLIPADEISGTDPGQVVIEVRAKAAASAPAEWHVTARYPWGSATSVTRSAIFLAATRGEVDRAEAPERTREERDAQALFTERFSGRGPSNRLAGREN